MAVLGLALEVLALEIYERNVHQLQTRPGPLPEWWWLYEACPCFTILIDAFTLQPFSVLVLFLSFMTLGRAGADAAPTGSSRPTKEIALDSNRQRILM